MKYYLAARFDTREMMKGVRDVMEAIGHKVTSSWIDAATDGISDFRQLGPATPSAIQDLVDIRAADAIVAFTSEPSSTGGYHVEFGYAMALEKKLIVVGAARNIFHALPNVRHYTDWPHFAMTLREEYVKNGR